MPGIRVMGPLRVNVLVQGVCEGPRLDRLALDISDNLRTVCQAFFSTGS